MPPNPSLMMSIPKINPFLLQTAVLMQNLLKIQQINQKPNENKDKKIILPSSSVLYIFESFKLSNASLLG